MLIERSVELAATPDFVLQGLLIISARELAGMAGIATSSGEALLERSGLLRLDQASRCHFGAQLGRPVDQGAANSLQLRWWNDRSRSLTPGFIGQLQLRPAGDQVSELTLTGQYHPRAHLYELADRAFLGRMASAVIATFLEQLRVRVLELMALTA